MTQILDSLKYYKEHEWVKISSEEASIGISDYAQNALGDIVYVELPEVGTIIQKGETFGVVESIKAVNDLYSPLNIEILEINNNIIDEPELINTRPYESWMIKVKVLNSEQLDELMNANEYDEFCRGLN